MSIHEKFLLLKEPHLHFAVGTEKSFCKMAWEWFYYDKLKFIPRIIRGKKCITVDKLFNEFAAAFQFPCYFGENWPAFDELINDLDWLPGQGYLVFISNFDEVLVKHDEDFKVLINILSETAKEWAKGRNYDDFATPPTPFHVILHCPIEKEIIIKTRFLKLCDQEIDIIYLSD